MEKHKALTVKDLIEILKIKDQSSIIILASDEEGNSFKSIQPEILDDYFVLASDLNDCPVGEVIKSENIYTEEEITEMEEVPLKVCVLYPY